jgi:hypothetical protein
MKDRRQTMINNWNTGSAETKRVIMDPLHVWLYDRRPTSIKEIVPNESTTLQEAVREQNRQGLDQGFKRRMSLKRGEYYTMTSKRMIIDWDVLQPTPGTV